MEILTNQKKQNKFGSSGLEIHSTDKVSLSHNDQRYREREEKGETLKIFKKVNNAGNDSNIRYNAKNY